MTQHASLSPERWSAFDVDQLYVRPVSDPAAHAANFRALLLFTPTAARQIPFVLGATPQRMT